MIFTLKCALLITDFNNKKFFKFDPPVRELWAKTYAILQLYRAPLMYDDKMCKMENDHFLFVCALLEYLLYIDMCKYIH